MNYHYQTARILANILDNQFSLGNLRFGFAPLIGLIPIIGDTTDALLSLYIVWIADQMKVPRQYIARMITNVLVNYLIGLVPIVGDATYLLRRVNIKNLQIIDRYKYQIS
jgi:hypothetical protein